MYEVQWDTDDGSFRLLADRGLYWPAQGTLFVADLHLGKEATFVRNHIAVPRGSSGATLDRLSKMLVATGARRLCMLGDLFHERSACAPDILDHFSRFRERHKGVAIQLVPGNHDRGVTAPATQFGLELLQEPQAFEGLTLAHYPQTPLEGTGLTLAGHLHPAIRIALPDFPQRRAPCFFMQANCLTLPAAGEFTGTALVRPTAEDRVACIIESHVFDLPQPHHPVGGRHA